MQRLTRRSRIILGGVFALVPLVIAETALRLFEPSRPSNAIAGTIALEDRSTGWKLRPGYEGPGPDLPGVRLSYAVRVNRDGFRGRSASHPACNSPVPGSLARL